MNLKTKVLEYFETYWKRNIFIKSISIFVVACFLINITNLPAFARNDDDDLKKKKVKTVETNSGVLYQGDQSYGAVSYMQSLEQNTKVDEKSGVISIKNPKNGRFEPKGFWDKEKQEAKIIGGEGKSVYNETYTQVIKNKLAKKIPIVRTYSEKSVTTDQQNVSQVQDNQQQVHTEVLPEQTVVQTIPREIVVPSKPIKEETAKSKQKEKIKQDSEAIAERETVDKDTNEVLITSREKIQQALSDLLKESKSTIEKELIRDAKDDKAKYQAVVDKLVGQTGLTEEKVRRQLDTIENEAEKQGVMDALYNLLVTQSKPIVNCAADALGSILSATSKGLLAFQAILANAIAGIFVKNNQGLISGTSSQLLLSAQAIQTVLAQYGEDYTGYNGNIGEVINALEPNQSVVVYVGGNHFITITKNDDGTFTRIDVNRETATFTSDELKNKLQSEYGLKENENTTFLAKENEKFAVISREKNLADKIGATTYSNPRVINGVTDPSEAAKYYKDFGDNSYEQLMQAMFGTTDLNSQQSKDFAAWYADFLRKVIIGCNRDAEKKDATDEDKERARAIQDQAAKDLAIIIKEQEILDKYPGSKLSGQIGQVMVMEEVDVSGNPNIPQPGPYYRVFTIAADYAKTKITINDNGKLIEVNGYYTTVKSSISEEEGCQVTRSDGTTYKVFGIAGEFNGQQVIYEYLGVVSSNGKFLMSDTSNIYLKDGASAIYQPRQANQSRPPSSQAYGDAAPPRNNYTRGIITEDDNGYRVTGAGSRITIKKQGNSGAWRAEVIGVGTEALAGSTLKIAAYDSGGRPNSIYITIDTGFMTYAGSFWAPSEGIVWQFDADKNTQEDVEKYVATTLASQIAVDDNAKQHLKNVNLELGNFDYRTARICGPPFSAAAIMHSTGITATVDVTAGYTYDGTASGDVCKLSVDQDTTFKIEEKDFQLEMLTTEAITVHVELSPSDGTQDWTFEDGTTSQTVDLRSGQVFSLGSILYNLSLDMWQKYLKDNDYGDYTIDELREFESTGKAPDSMKKKAKEVLVNRGVSVKKKISDDDLDKLIAEKLPKITRVSIVNKEGVRILEGYKTTGEKDEDGNDIYDYTQPIYSDTVVEFKVSGDSNGKYVLADDMYVSVTDTGWAIGSQVAFDNGDINTGRWLAGSEISIVKNGKNYDISITKGDFECKDIKGVELPERKDDDDKEDDGNKKYDGPYIVDANIQNERSNGNGGHLYDIKSGIIKGISGDGLRKKNMGSYLFVPGSDFNKGSIIAEDGTKAKYDSRIKEDGSIDAYGASGWQKFKDKFLGFLSIVASAILVLAPVFLGPIGAVFTGLYFGTSLFDGWKAKTYGLWNHVNANASNKDAVKHGGDLTIAGLAAVAVIAIAVASIISGIFTGGASTVAGIAAAVAIATVSFAGAVAGSIQVLNLTYSGIQAIRAGKAGQAALMFFFALIMAVLTCAGASSAGSTLGAGLVKLGAQFFVKMAVGAVVGAAIGAAVTGIVYGIRYAIAKSQGKADEFDWSNFTEDMVTAVVTGAFSGANVGAQLGAVVARNAASGIAKTTIGQAIKQFAIDSIKEALVRQAGQTTLQFVGAVAKSIVSTLMTLGSMALNVYITYTTSRSLVDSVKTGDVAGAMQALYTLISINIVSPIMSAHASVKAAEQSSASVINEGIELDKVDDIVENVTTLEGQQAATDLGTLSDLVAKDGEVATILRGVDVGNLTKFTPTMKIIAMSLTTVAGAGLGMLAAYLVALVRGETVTGQDLAVGAGVGGALGFGFGAVASKTDWINMGNAFKSSFAKSFKPFLGALVKGQTWGSAFRALGSLFGGVGLGVATGAIICVINGKKPGGKNIIIGGVAGGVVGGGFGSAWASGAYDFGGIKSVFSTIKNNPRTLFNSAQQYFQKISINTIMMIQNMIVFNTRMAYITSILNRIYYSITGDSLANTALVKFINDVTGMNLFKSEKDKENDAEREKKKKAAEKEGKIFDEPDVVYKFEFGKTEVNASIKQNWETFSGPNMWVGSTLAGFAMPILAPALQYSPFLGSFMGLVNSAGKLMTNEVASMMYMTGIKNRILGFIAKQLFGEGQGAEIASQVFLKMFDEMPDVEQARAIEFLESSKINVPAVNEAMLKLQSAKTAEQFNEILKDICLNQELKLNLDYGIVSQYVQFGMSFAARSQAFLAEIVINGLRVREVFNEGYSEVTFRESFNASNFARSPIMLEAGGIFTDEAAAATAHKLNFLSACAEIIALNIPEVNSGAILEGLEINTLGKILDVANAKSPGFGIAILMNYADAIASARDAAGFTIPKNAEVLINIAKVIAAQNVHISDLEAQVRRSGEEEVLDRSPDVVNARIEELVKLKSEVSELEQKLRDAQPTGESWDGDLTYELGEALDTVKARLPDNVDEKLVALRALANIQLPIVMTSANYMKALLQRANLSVNIFDELSIALDARTFGSESYLVLESFRNRQDLKDAKQIKELRQNISDLKESGGLGLNQDQQAELAALQVKLFNLEAKYLPSAVIQNNYINDLLEKVSKKELTALEFNLIVGASDIAYYRYTTPEMRGKLDADRIALRKFAHLTANELVLKTAELRESGKISELEANKIFLNVRQTYIDAAAAKLSFVTRNTAFSSVQGGSVSNFLAATAESQLLVNSVFARGIITLQLVDGVDTIVQTFTERGATVFKTLDGEPVEIIGIEGNSTGSLRLRIQIGGEERSVILKGNLELLAQNNEFVKQLISKFEEVAHIILAESAARSQIESVRIDGKKIDEGIKSALSAVLNEVGAFEPYGNDRHKGYKLSGQAEDVIGSIFGDYGEYAKSFIDAVNLSVDAARMNEVLNTIAANPLKLINICSANANPMLLSPLYKELAAKFNTNTDAGEPIEMSSADLYILDDNIRAKGMILDDVIKNLQDLRAAKEKDEIKKLEQKLKPVFDGTGFSDVESLLPRLELLKNNPGAIKDFYGTDGIVQQAKAFVSANMSSVDSTGPKRLKSGALDELRVQVNKMASEGKGEQAVNFLRVVMKECMKLGTGIDIRASQSEMTTTLQNDINAALGMGGGKTVSLALDAAVTRVLMGETANIEILVGNGDLENYTSASKEARKFLEFIGMKVVAATDFKKDGQETDIQSLKQAYSDPNTVVIMDPIVRGHLKNDAAMQGGIKGAELNAALDSVNRVLVDEVHLWSLTKTAAVIGGDNRPPSTRIIGKAIKIAEAINANEIYEKMIDGEMSKVREAAITMDGRNVKIMRFDNIDQANQEHLFGDYICIIGQQSASLEIKISDDLRDHLINKINTIGENTVSQISGDQDGSNNYGRLNSMLRGLFSVSDNGGMAFGADGKVKPVGAQGIEENMVIGDIYLQLGFALGKGLGEPDKIDFSQYFAERTQMSTTSMQTSLAAIYSGASARMVGVSGTVSGLQQLIINRTGSGRVYNITGEKVDPSMFDEVLNLDSGGTKGLAGVIKECLDNIAAAARSGDTEKSYEILDNILMLGKTQTSIDAFREAVRANYDQLRELGIEVYEFTDKQGKWIDKEGKVDSIGVGKDGKPIGLSDIAKGKNLKRIIIANEKGATGIDYQGNFVNIIADLHLISNTDLAQALKRSGRPNPRQEGAEPARWLSKRILAYSQTKVQAELSSFQNNSAFVGYARELWQGMKAGGYMEDKQAVRWLDIIEKGNFNASNPEVVDALLRLQNGSTPLPLTATAETINTFFDAYDRSRMNINEMVDFLKASGSVFKDVDPKVVKEILDKALDAGLIAKAVVFQQDSSKTAAIKEIIKMIVTEKPLLQGNYDLSKPEVMNAAWNEIRAYAEGKDMPPEMIVLVRALIGGELLPESIDAGAAKRNIINFAMHQEIAATMAIIQKSVEKSDLTSVEKSDLTNENSISQFVQNLNKFIIDNVVTAVKQQTATKEILTFMSKIQDLRSIDASIRFAINDSIRDRMVISVLRKVVASLPEGLARDVAKKELNDALKTHNSFAKEDFSLDSLKAESPEAVMLKAFRSSSEEAEMRFSRLKEALESLNGTVRSALYKLSAETKGVISKQLEVINSHLESIELAVPKEPSGEASSTGSGQFYWNSPVITGKGLSDAIDMIEFVQIMRSFEEYIMPISKIVDSAGAIKTSSAIEDIASQQIMEYVNKDDTLSQSREKPGKEGEYERVLTPKGELFVKIMRNVANEDTKWISMCAWLMTKLGIQSEMPTDADTAERTKKNIENVRKIVDKLLEVNKDVNFAVLTELLSNFLYLKEPRNRDAIDLEGFIKGVLSSQADVAARVSASQAVPSAEAVIPDTELKAGMPVSEALSSRKISLAQQKIKEALDKDPSLSRSGDLTQKGRIFAKIAQQFVDAGSDKKFIKFLSSGPLSLLLSDKLKAKLRSIIDGSDSTRTFDDDIKAIEEITNALWSANVWEFSQVEKLYGVYQLLSSEARDSLITSVSQLKDILSAQHSATIKKLEGDNKLPDAQVVAFAKLILSKAGSSDRVVEGVPQVDVFEGKPGARKYLENVVARYKKVEDQNSSMKSLGNAMSEVSTSILPKWMRLIGCGVAMMFYMPVKLYRVYKSSRSVNVDIADAYKMFGKDMNPEALFYIAGKVDSKTPEALSNFKELVKAHEGKKLSVANVFDETGASKFARVAIRTTIASVAAAGVVSLFVFAPIALAIVGFVFAGLIILAKKSTTVAKALSSVWSWFKKFLPDSPKISDINKFSKIGNYVRLLRDGNIDLSNLTAKSLLAALNDSGMHGEYAVSDGEAALILGSKDLEKIQNWKKNEIERIAEDKSKDPAFRSANPKTGADEKDKDYTKRLKELAAKGVSSPKDFWTVARVGKIVDILKYDQKEQQKLIAVLFTGAKGDYERMSARFSSLKGQLGYLAAEIGNLPFSALSDDESFHDNEISNLFKDRQAVSVVEEDLSAKMKMTGAGEKMVGRMGVGFTKPEELQVAILKVLSLFKTVKEAANYLGIANFDTLYDGDVESTVRQAAFDTYKDALDNFSKGNMTLDQLKQESEVIRTVAEILITAKGEREVLEKFNAGDHNTIQGIVNLDAVAVNRHVFVDMLKGSIKGEGDTATFFEIDINALRQKLATPISKGERALLSNKREDLLPIIQDSRKRGKNRTALMEIRNIRAVASAA